jgi:transposase
MIRHCWRGWRRIGTQECAGRWRGGLPIRRCWRGGSEQYPPQMMLALLIYSYATGRFSSRDIERATHADVAVRYICGGEYHPDHDTICEFRRRNRQAFEAMFVKVLLLAQESKCLKKVGTIAVDGTKILANASKHAAISYERTGKQIEMLQAEVKALTAKAEKSDFENRKKLIFFKITKQVTKKG